MTKWIAAAVALVVAGVVLYVLIRDDGGETTKKTPAPQVDNPKTTTTTTGDRERPKLRDPKKTRPATRSSDNYTEHITKDGVRIRDKRGRIVENTDMEKPPKRSFKSLKIEAAVVAEMGNKLRGVARKCRDAHPGDLSKGAKVQPRVAFEIKAGQLSVTEAEVALESIEKDSEFSRCFYSGTIGLAVAAAGHRDVERHRMLVPIDLDKI